jgi:hypothetical protein
MADHLAHTELANGGAFALLVVHRHSCFIVQLSVAQIRGFTAFSKMVGEQKGQ